MHAVMHPNVFDDLCTILSFAFSPAMCVPPGENLLVDDPDFGSEVRGSVEQMTEADLKFLSGNAFHLALMGSWMMYILSRTGCVRAPPIEFESDDGFGPSQ